jgi:hypothetical protein
MFQRLRRDLRRQPVTAAGCQTTNSACLGSRLFEEGGPVHPRGSPDEVVTRPHVVGIVIVGRRLARALALRDRRLQRQYRARALVSTAEAGEREHLLDVFAIPLAKRRLPGGSADIVLAIRQAQPSLQQECAVGLFSMDALLHGEAQHARGLIDAESHRIDIGAQAASQQARERRFVRHSRRDRRSSERHSLASMAVSFR